MRCFKCNKELGTGDTDGLCYCCRLRVPEPIRMGWKCPECGRIHSPDTLTCNCNNVIDKLDVYTQIIEQ